MYNHTVYVYIMYNHIAYIMYFFFKSTIKIDFHRQFSLVPVLGTKMFIFLVKH